MDTVEERFDRIGRALHGLYATLTERLIALPLPIELPLLGGEPEDHMAVLDALEGALSLLREMPLAKGQRARLRASIVEWSTLYELAGTLEECGPTGLRLTSAEVCSARIAHFIQNYDQQEAKNKPHAS